jgi:hypothetical protein
MLSPVIVHHRFIHRHQAEFIRHSKDSMVVCMESNRVVLHRWTKQWLKTSIGTILWGLGVGGMIK